MVLADPTIWSLPLGAALDAVLGDPRGWPHPVRAVGALIAATERLLRALLARMGGGPRAERAAGVVLVTVVLGVTTFTAWAVIALGDRVGDIGGLLSRTLLVYWALATRSLGLESALASEATDLATARRELAMIVGRDTEHLDQSEICRACVETVAENSNDAVVATLFWLAIGGPVGAWAYKAVSTLDSMVGYRDPRYLWMGWASARLDDLASLLPARLTWLLIAVASLVLGERAGAALRIGWRDGRKHPSPNSAWSEAAMAGALGVQLGGPATYGGKASLKPLLGDPGDPIGPATVRRAIRLMYVAALLAVVLAWVARTLPEVTSHRRGAGSSGTTHPALVPEGRRQRADAEPAAGVGFMQSSSLGRRSIACRFENR